MSKTENNPENFLPPVLPEDRTRRWGRALATTVLAAGLAGGLAACEDVGSRLGASPATSASAEAEPTVAVPDVYLAEGLDNAANLSEAFRRLPESKWISADQTMSLPLADGRTFWVFDDTVSRGNGFVHSSGIMEIKDSLTVVNDGKQLFPNEPDGSYYWPTAVAELTPGNLLISATQQKQNTTPAPGTLSFPDQVGTKAAIFTYANGSEPTFSHWVSWPDSPENGKQDGTVITWGQGMITDGQNLVVYGTSFNNADYDGKKLYGGTVPIGDLLRSTPASPASFNLSNQPIWQEDNHGVSSEISTIRMPDGTVKIVTKDNDFYGSEIVALSGPDPLHLDKRQVLISGVQNTDPDDAQKIIIKYNPAIHRNPDGSGYIASLNIMKPSLNGLTGEELFEASKQYSVPQFFDVDPSTLEQ